jgi:hypothetical protein
MTAGNGIDDATQERISAMRADLAERRQASQKSMDDLKGKPVPVQNGLTTRDKLNAVRDILRAHRVANLTGVEVAAVVSQPLPYGKDVSKQQEL